MVVVAPSLDDLPRLIERLEPMHVQALVPRRTVESIDVAVIRGLPRMAEGEVDLVVVRPQVQQPLREFAAVVPAECQLSRVAASLGLSIDRRRDPRWLTWSHHRQFPKYCDFDLAKT